MKITVSEVARAAGVSVGSVSRALNGEPGVSHELSDRVRRAVASLGYRPLRRRSAEGRSALRGRTVALLLLGMDRSLVHLPVIAAAIHGIEGAASSAGARLLIADLPRLDQVPAGLGRGRIDGLILKSALQGDVLRRAAPALRSLIDTIPAVWFLGRPPGGRGDVVTSEDRTIGRLAAEHLVGRGHHRLAFLNPKPDHLLFRNREEAFVWRARELGASVSGIPRSNRRWDLPLSAVSETGPLQEILDSLLRVPRRPSAVFVPADSIAAALYRALQERGLRAGHDLAVVSCNHEPPLLAGLYPRLTTIDIRAEEIGQGAVRQLAARLAAPDAPPAETTLEPVLLEADSVPVLGKGRSR